MQRFDTPVPHILKERVEAGTSGYSGADLGDERVPEPQVVLSRGATSRTAKRRHNSW